VLDNHLLGRILRHERIFGDNHGDRLADVPHALVGDHRLQKSIEGGVVELESDRDLRNSSDFTARDHIDHASHFSGRSSVDIDDPGVRKLAPHNSRHGLPRPGDVVDELTLAPK
jgi:hypothetical protein